VARRGDGVVSGFDKGEPVRHDRVHAVEFERLVDDRIRPVGGVSVRIVRRRAVACEEIDAGSAVSRRRALPELRNCECREIDRALDVADLEPVHQPQHGLQQQGRHALDGLRRAAPDRSACLSERRKMQPAIHHETSLSKAAHSRNARCAKTRPSPAD
jgi:hypothetical protein